MLQFKEWLEEQETLDEGKVWDAFKKKFVYPAAVGASALASTFGQTPTPTPTPTPTQQPQTQTSQAQPAKRPADPELMALIASLTAEAEKTRERAKPKPPATKERVEQFLSDEYNLKPGDIKWFLPSNYLAKFYGKDWQKALAQAKAHKGYSSTLMDWDKLNKPVPVIIKAPPGGGSLGRCQTRYIDGARTTFCWVVKGAISDDPLADRLAHELGHAAQKPSARYAGTQQRLIRWLGAEDKEEYRELYNYLSKDVELAAWLGQIKRWYYQETGKIAGTSSASDIMAMIKDKIDEVGFENALGQELEAVAAFYLIHQQAEKMGKEKELLNLMKDFLGGIVKTSPGQTSPISRPMQWDLQRRGLV
jgi:hypothetical protein